MHRALGMLLVGTLLGSATGRSAEPPASGRPRKVILFIGDGFGPNTLALAYLYRHLGQGHGGEPRPLEMEKLMRQGRLALVQPIPDIGELVIESAGAATTLSSGVRVTNDQIGVASDGKTVRLITEEAHAAGLAVGIVTTVSIVHATPAAFFGHAASRSNEMDLAAQLPATGFEVFLGGGARYFLPPELNGEKALGHGKMLGGDRPGGRTDGRNLIEEARGRGYRIVGDAEELKAAVADLSAVPETPGGAPDAVPPAGGATTPAGAPDAVPPAGGATTPAGAPDATTPAGAPEAATPAGAPGQKLFGLFASDATPMVLDRRFHEITEVPSLAEQTRAALAVLDRDPDGFLLVVEGGKIDFAGHRNDAASLLWETLEFDEAIGVALEYALRDQETLLLVTADHETGGMSFSYQDVPPGDEPLPFPPQLPGRDYRKKFPNLDNLRRLVGQKVSLEAMGTEMGPQPSPETVRETVARYTGVELSAEEAALVSAGKSWSPFFSASQERGWQRGVLLGLVLGDDYGVTWSSKNHTTIPVMLMCLGPGSERCSGFLENTAVFGILQQVLPAAEPAAGSAP